MNFELDVLKIISPFTAREIEQIRMHILQDMKQKGFEYYLEQINNIVRRVPQVLDSDEALLDDNLWQQPNTWWQTESPWLHAMYKKSIFGIQTVRHAGIARMLGLFMRESFVDMFLGMPETLPQQQVLLFRGILLSYFSNLEGLWPIMLNIDYVHSKRKEKKATFSEPRKQAIQSIKSAIAGSGPFILKVLQQINSVVGSSLKIGDVTVGELTNDVLADVPGLTSEEIDFITSSLEIEPHLKRNIDRKPLKSGSLAQTHCSFYDGPEPVPIFLRDLNHTNHNCRQDTRYPVIVKLLKPIYAYFFLCEVYTLLDVTWKFFRTMAKDNLILLKQMRQVLLFLVREFAAEFDYSIEAKNTQNGYAIYNQPSKKIRSIRLVQFATNPFPVLVLEVASRQPLQHLLNQLEASIPDTATKKAIAALQRVVTTLVELWVLNLFWGTGFFHGDLHAGNILVPTLDQIIRDENPVLWIIDFGSAGKLTSKMQCNLVDAILLPNAMHDFQKYIPVRANDDNGSGEPQAPKNLAKFFRNFNQLTPQQQKALNKRMNPEAVPTSSNVLSAPDLIQMHEANLHLAGACVRSLWNLCEVKHRTYDDFLQLRTALLDYSKPPQFGYLLLNFLQHAKDIGQCTSNQTLMFGRALSYVLNMVDRLDAICGDEALCPPWRLTRTMRNALLKHPSQLANVLRKKKACS
jgi:hypothetical protein